MPECGIADFGCRAGEAVASAALDGIAQTVGQAMADTLRLAFTWWIEIDAINPDNDAVRGMQEYTIPIAAVMLTGSVLVQAIRMTLARRKDPAINVALGLIRFAVINAVGLTVLGAAMRAADAYAEFLLRDVVDDFVERMGTALGAITIGTPLLMLAFAAIGFILGLIQFVLAIIRQAGILVLAAMLPLAASGSINDSTKAWMSRLASWLIALVLYKPMAAMIYAIGITMMTDSDDVVVVVIGLIVLSLAVIAMPAMMRFFAWSQLSVTGGSGVGGALAAGASAASTTHSLVAARRQQMTGPGAAPPPPGPGPAPAPGPSGGTSPAGGGVGSAVAAVQMIRQAGNAAAEKFTSEVATGATGRSQAGPPTARNGGGAPATGPGGTTGAPTGGTAGPTGPGNSTPPGGGAAGAVATVRGAQQTAQNTANKMTGEEQRG